MTGDCGETSAGRRVTVSPAAEIVGPTVGRLLDAGRLSGARGATAAPDEPLAAERADPTQWRSVRRVSPGIRQRLRHRGHGAGV